MKIEKNCETCGKPFQADTREINRGNAKYCCKSCASKAPKSMQYNTICKHCGREFISSMKSTKYCSDSCKQKSYRARQRNKTEDDFSIKSLYIIFENIPCELCSWDKTTRDLHHIIEVSNGGTNDINNIISVCPNCHRMIHNNLISKDDLIKVVETRTISSPSKT